MGYSSPPPTQLRKTASIETTTSTSSKSSSASSWCSSEDRDFYPVVMEKTKRQQKRVSFYNRVKILRIRQLCEYSEEEIGNTWYSHEDYLNIRRDCELTVYAMTSNGQIPLRPDQCTRGLECRTPSSVRDRYQKRQQLVDLILDEQDFLFEVVQSGEDYFEYEGRLAEVSISMTSIDRGAAHRRGKRDERELLTGSDHHIERDVPRMASSRGDLPIPSSASYYNNSNNTNDDDTTSVSHHSNNLFNELLTAISKQSTASPPPSPPSPIPKRSTWSAAA